MAGRIAIIGGGPAGLMAAEVAAKSGAAVTIYEHKRSLGRRFVLAGRGGLNITHSEPIEQFLSRYGAAEPMLTPAICSFSPTDLADWCSGHGEATFTGSSGRVFPQSFRATPLLRSWLTRLANHGVTAATQHRWVGWHSDGGVNFEAPQGPLTIEPDAVIFALGGASWPGVGADGTWAPIFADAGIAVEPLEPANSGVQVAWTSVIADRFAGTPVKNAVFSQGDMSVRGDAVVTRTGLEGGPIYALGPAIRAELARRDGSGDPIALRVDLHPDLDIDRLTARLSKRRPKASAASWLSSAQIPPVSVALAREVTNNVLPEQPGALARLLKSLPLVISSLASLERAISTAGGVAWSEVDERFMLRNLPGTFVAGEMLDWEAPTGGYLLQACFSTGVAAAQGALRWCG